MTISNDVACFGELLWDFFELEEKSEKVASGLAYRRELGGASANVAAVLASLGVKVRAIGAVGDDALGDALRGDLDARGVDVDGVTRLKNSRTGITLVSRNAAGEPKFSPYREGTADMALQPAHVASSMAKVGYAVVCSTSMLPALEGATTKFLAALEKAKGTLIVDLNMRPHLWTDTAEMRAAAGELASHAAVVKGSEKDLEALAGKRGMSWLEQHAKGATWVLTRGENGAACVGAHGEVTYPTKRVRCVDATGAGDAFVAGLTAVLVRAKAKPGTPGFRDPKLWSRAMEIGHILGARAVSAVGATAGLGTLADLRARLAATKP